MRLSRFILHANPTATTPAADTLQFPVKGIIRAILFNVQIQSSTNNSRVIASISRSPLEDYGSSSGGLALRVATIARIVCCINFTTSGQAIAGYNEVFETNDPVSPGDTLYLNVVISGTASSYCDALAIVEE